MAKNVTLCGICDSLNFSEDSYDLRGFNLYIVFIFLFVGHALNDVNVIPLGIQDFLVLHFLSLIFLCFVN